MKLVQQNSTAVLAVACIAGQNPPRLICILTIVRRLTVSHGPKNFFFRSNLNLQFPSKFRPSEVLPPKFQIRSAHAPQPSMLPPSKNRQFRDQPPHGGHVPVAVKVESRQQQRCDVSRFRGGVLMFPRSTSTATTTMAKDEGDASGGSPANEVSTSGETRTFARSHL